MDVSSRMDGLQQQVADARNSVQAAVSESRDQLKRRIVQAEASRGTPMHSTRRRPRLAPAPSGTRCGPMPQTT
jgi:hypothetical protein